MKKYILLFGSLWYISGLPVCAVSITQFLSTAKKDYILDYQNKKIAYLEDFKSNLPFIDEVELRYRNEGFTRPRYSLRISPNGFGESRAGKKVYTSMFTFNKVRKDMLLNRALRKRYMLAAELLYRQAMLRLNKELDVLYTDRINVLKQRSSEINFDFNTLIEAEDDLTKLRLKMIEQKSEESALEQEIKEYLPPGGKIEFDTANIISVDFVKNLLAKDTFTLDTNNVYLQTSKLELEVSKSRFELENAQARRYLSFLELSYDHGEMNDQIDNRDRNREYDFNRAVILQFGLALPFINTDRIDVNRRKIAYLNDKGQYEDLKTDLTQDILQLTEEIHRYVSQYTLLQEREQHISSEASLKTYLQMEGVDPLILLRTRESTIKSKQNIEGIKFEVLLCYIKLMDITGKLSKEPLVNLISSKQEPLED